MAQVQAHEAKLMELDETVEQLQATGVDSESAQARVQAVRERFQVGQN